MRERMGFVLVTCTALLSACRPAPVDVTVTLRDYAFDPAVIEVPAGAEVTLTADNRGHHEHYWALLQKDYEFSLPFTDEDVSHVLAIVAADVGSVNTITFQAPSVRGEYVVICSIPGHAEKGMVGTLIVR